uniref:Uncharacterized protein n=1 Tax=Solanum tuberosum TaxID=4113 RepID=M1D0S6_SOLTU
MIFFRERQVQLIATFRVNTIPNPKITSKVKPLRNSLMFNFQLYALDQELTLLMDSQSKDFIYLKDFSILGSQKLASDTHLPCLLIRIHKVTISPLNAG